jgi:ABC-type Fe3+ transport system substrate-binding protein
VSAGPGGISLLAKSRQPNAAKVYLNWLLSREGQALLVKSNGAQSRRTDVPVPPEPWKFPPEPSYWKSYDEAGVGLTRSRMVPLVKEIFGE